MITGLALTGERASRSPEDLVLPAGRSHSLPARQRLCLRIVGRGPVSDPRPVGGVVACGGGVGYCFADAVV